VKSRIQKAGKTIHRTVEEELGEILGHLGGDSEDGPDASQCPKHNCSRREKYRILLTEAIRDLEDTRGSFKSSRLAALRKKLQQTLDSLPGVDSSR